MEFSEVIYYRICLWVILGRYNIHFGKQPPSEPSMELKILAKEIIKVYSSSWFEMKLQSTCNEISQHFFEII